jgi:hypothetical protein
MRFAPIHEAIVTAKTRRLQRELMFHGNPGDAWPGEGVAERTSRKSRSGR